MEREFRIYIFRRTVNLELPPAFIKNKPAKIKIYSNKEKN